MLQALSRLLRRAAFDAEDYIPRAVVLNYPYNPFPIEYPIAARTADGRTRHLAALEGARVVELDVRRRLNLHRHEREDS